MEDFDDEAGRGLLALVAHGDEAAFRRLYELLSRRVFAFAFHSLGDAVTATEVVSDTLFQVWKNAASFRGDSRLTTWVLGIARHKLLDRLRAQSGAHEDIDDYSEVLADDEPDGFAVIARRQREQGVHHCLQRLQDPHRQCLFLVFYEGLSLREVSEVQAVPENTVKTRLFHARGKIKQCLRLWLGREGETA